MAIVPTSGETVTSSSRHVGPAEEPLFRFGLRQLFYFVALISVVLAAAVLSQGIAAVAMLLAALVVAAHVFSTALASRLRARSELEQAIGRTDGLENTKPMGLLEHAHHATIPCGTRSPWHARGSTALPWLPRLIVSGLAVGGITGASVLAATLGHRITLGGIVVGGLSSAVVGGWFAFLGGSFYGIFRHGLRDAINEQQQDQSSAELTSKPSGAFALTLPKTRVE
jgi:hypothetical protein